MKRAPGYTEAQCRLASWLDSKASKGKDEAYSAEATEATLLRRFGKSMDQLTDAECEKARALFPGG